MKKLFLLLILLPDLAWGGNFGSSIEGKDANVSFIHTSAIDSAHFIFAYPDTSNWYDSVFTYPVAWGSSKILNGAGLDLDSIGVHIIKVRYYSGGSVAGHTAGVWLHETETLGTGLDSATTSRIIGRKVWGLQEEAGDDSSTMAERLVTATAIVDTASVGRSVWDNDIVSQANRTVTASCAGSGARTVVIWIKDITDSTGIPGFEIDIEDSIGGGGVYGNTTNPSGCCTLSLDDATWTIHLQKVPYSITSPVYETISGNTTLTYYATPFTPGSPPADSLCVVYGYVKKSNGTPYVGAKVEMWMDVYPVTFGGILIDVVTKQVVYTNTAGRFEFSDGVYYSSSLNPSNLKWKVRIKTTNWLWEGRVIVPSQASWEIEIPDL